MTEVDGDLRQLLGEVVTVLRLQQERIEELSGEESDQSDDQTEGTASG